MRLIDEQYLKTPFYGSRRMAAWLTTQGEEVNRKRVEATDGVDGPGGDPSGASNDGAEPGPQGLSVSAERSDGRASGSGLVIGYHLHPDLKGSCT